MGWNFGPRKESFVTVEELVGYVIKFWGSGSWEDKQDPKSPKETKELYLDSTLAEIDLNCSSVWGIEKTVKKTLEWYKKYKDNDIYELCISQIADFENDIKL